MKLNFGIRFVLATAISFILAFTVIHINWAGKNPFSIIGGELLSASTSLAMFLIILGYYLGLRTILKTRVGLLSYLIYVLIGVSLVLATFIQLIEFIIEIEGAVFIPWEGLFWALFLPLGIAYMPPLLVYQMQKIREHPTFRQYFLEEKGGSSSFASVGTFASLRGRLRQNLFTYWFDKRGVISDGLFLGRSMAIDDPFRRPVVLKQDNHHICMAKTGSGKFISALSHWLSMISSSSILALDIKGELSLATANRRHYQNIGGKKTTRKHLPNGRVTVLDPFSWIARHDFASTCYNFLNEIDPNSPYARSLITALSDGLFAPDDVEQMHFREVPKMIFEGFVVHVLTAYPKKCHNLPFVYDLIRSINPETGLLDIDYYQKLLLDMSKNDAIGGLAQETARILIEMGGNERGSMQSTLGRHLKWIGEPKMREHLKDGEFSFWDFGVKKIKVKGKEVDLIETVYIVIPDQLIQEQMRYVRIIFNLGIRIMQFRTEKPQSPTLVMIDEFPRLGGSIDAVTEGFGILRSYGIKLIVFLQTLGQLKRDYPKQWSSMIGNSTLQIFGVGDLETAEYVSQTLGAKIIRQYNREKTALGFSKKVLVNETARELLTPSEVMTKLGKTNNMQILFPNEGLPMRLERLAFKPMRFGKRKFKSLGLGGLRKQIEDIY